MKKKLYCVYEEKDNIVYSIDMLRLKTYISYNEFTKIEFRLNTLWKEYIKKSYSSSQMKNFFYNYIIEIEEGISFWFGFLHNTEKRKDSIKRDTFYYNQIDKYNFSIEFNPNKLKNNPILLYLLGISGDWVIKSFDLAIDLKVNILDIIWDLNGKRLEKIDNRGYDNKTIYIGTGDGRIKIYNKKRESNIDEIFHLTRVEISRQMDDFQLKDIKKYSYDNVFPRLYLKEYMFSFEDYKDKTLLAILYAVLQGFPIRDLSRAYKEKIKKLLQGGNAIRFDNKCVSDLLRQTVYYYFINNRLCRWS